MCGVEMGRSAKDGLLRLTQSITPCFVFVGDVSVDIDTSVYELVFSFGGSVGGSTAVTIGISGFDGCI